MAKPKQNREKIVKITEKKGSWYIYIKYPGKIGRSYKLRDETELDPYIKYYEDKAKNKKKGSINKYLIAYSLNRLEKRKQYDRRLQLQAERYMQKVKDRKDIQKVIKKGIVSETIRDIHNIGDKEIQDTYRKLLNPLVLDKEILNLLCKEENMQKLKHRFEYRATVNGEEDKEIGELLHIGKKTLKEVVDELKDVTRRGMSYGDFSKSVKDLGQKGWSFEYKNTDNLKQIDIKIIFRRG